MRKLADLLQGVTRLGFDTAPLIYFVERNEAFLTNDEALQVITDLRVIVLKDTEL